MAEAPDTLVERCRAAVLALPADAVFSHDTAVALGFKGDLGITTLEGEAA